MFLTSICDAYDTVVEIVDSKWVKEFYNINRQIADFWKVKHFAIFLDSNGLYEFIARGFTPL
jgi:hypothetical protein